MTSTQIETEAVREMAHGVPSVSVEEREADPHGVFRRYRANTPLIERQGAFVVLRAMDVERLFKDPRLGQPRTEFLNRLGITEGALFDLFALSMVGADEETHARLRAPLTRTFAARVIRAMRPIIRARAEALIDALGNARAFDLIAQFSSLIPAMTIAGILGLPEEDVPHFTAVVYELTTFLGFTAGQDLGRIKVAAEDLKSYVHRTFEDRRIHPRDDFLTRLITDLDETGSATPEEAIVQMMSLIIAGTDTTRVAGGGVVSLLLQHREQWDAVCGDASLIPKAIAEALRFEPSVGSTARFSLEPIELDGKIVPKDAAVSLSLMSAMRDERVYANPDTFDIFRDDGPRIHPIFGGGAHRCLGEALAKAELEESLAVLTQRLPQLRLAGAPPIIIGHATIRRIGPMHCTV
ncbi:cytochrome P450 [Bradyrhizobium liaoningense]|uniref:cytochrome P450 n=1 Tax=Bradyrhizobium liaoningense TaxID=43992 RepID=UPI001BACD5DC|nr:cytochrome P450 [Bradyrhizobium liaoningense]MBR0947658.1 cytochrome P450 [Bradyrhizobium liaoningense]